MKLRNVAVLACAAALMAVGSAHADEIGKPAKPYKIYLLDKSMITSDQLKGKVVVVNRWATWCTPCKAEMVVFENYLRTHPDTDLKIYAVTTELTAPSEKLKPLQGILHYPLGLSVLGWGYGIKNAVPTSYVIDRTGVVRFAAAGAFNDQSFDALITPLLKQAPPSAQ
ncbi:MAG: TlpA family protein disulfide reductase [Phenylobacterium sp.]